MFTLAHDHIDKDLNVRPDAFGLSPDAFWRPIVTETVMRRHMIAVGRMLAVARCASVGGDAFPLKIYLDGARSDPRPQLLLQKLVWH